jgi:hypothetical protein
MSPAGRLVNVFVTPSEVFESVKAAPPSTGNWLVPALLMCLVGIIATFVVFSQDSIVQQMKEKQERALEKKLEKLPKEQREQIREIAEKWSNPGLIKVFGSLGAVANSFGWLFLVALVVWLLGAKLFKGSFTYMRAVEVCGLAGMINVLGGVIWMLLAVVKGSLLATAGPVLLVGEIDPSNLGHAFLSGFNVVAIWYVGVLAVGLSKLSGVSVAKAAVWLYGLWVVVTAGLIVAGWAVQR